MIEIENEYQLVIADSLSHLVVMGHKCLLDDYCKPWLSWNGSIMSVQIRNGVRYSVEEMVSILIKDYFMDTDEAKEYAEAVSAKLVFIDNEMLINGILKLCRTGK